MHSAIPGSHYEMAFKPRALPLTLITITVLLTLEALAIETLFQFSKNDISS